MGSLERRVRERHETRDRIMDAARELFVRDGVDAVTMRAIAERIEYTPTAIYHHFRDKQALLEELCHADFRALAQTFIAIGHIPDPVERLRRIGEAYVAFAFEHPAQYEWMFMTKRPPVLPQEGERDDPEENAYAFLLQTIRDGIAQRRYRDEYDDADQLAQMIWPAIHGVISIHHFKKTDPWVDWREPRTTALMVMDTIFRGVLRDPTDADRYRTLPPLQLAAPAR
jgi:AcrR family transcriptional regulator